VRDWRVSNLDERAIGAIRAVVNHLVLTVLSGSRSALRRHNAGAISQTMIGPCSLSPIGLGVVPEEICLCLNIQMSSGYGMIPLHKMAGAPRPTGSQLR
jgi:hypothetical protein